MNASPKQTAIKVTLIGSVLDLVLGVIKILAGIFSASFALVSDGIHSLSDLVTDVFVLMIARISHEKPDTEHPYGHARFETVGTIVIALALFGIALLICYDAGKRLGSLDTMPVPGWPALLVAALSIASKEWIFRYTARAAKKLKSSMLMANAWHSRTDAMSSIGVLVGIAGAQLGFLWMDLAGAVFVALLIGKIAWDLLLSSFKEIVDTAIPSEEVEKIRAHIMAADDTVGVHSLRSRQSGGKTFLDIHIQVDSKISVSEGHYVGERIAASLQHKFPEIHDLVIHIDPELDIDSDPDKLVNLPTRREARESLQTCWRALLAPQKIQRMELHYLQEKIEVEIYLSGEEDPELLIKLKQAAKHLPWLKSLRAFRELT